MPSETEKARVRHGLYANCDRDANGGSVFDYVFSITRIENTMGRMFRKGGDNTVFVCTNCGKEY